MTREETDGVTYGLVRGQTRMIDSCCRARRVAIRRRNFNVINEPRGYEEGTVRNVILHKKKKIELNPCECGGKGRQRTDQIKHNNMTEKL